MAQLAEFEESEYEDPLRAELLLSSQNALWSPGSALEGHFGFDCALFSAHNLIWPLLGYPVTLPGVVLNDFTWGPFWRQIGHTRMLPTFKTNLFLQFKRPEHRIGRNTRYAQMGIPGQYWQFAIKAHQQAALERVAQRLRNRVVICYASPAFHKAAQLFDHQMNQRLVATSTFVQVHRLTGHQYWLYDRPGSTGIGHSEPQRIEDTPFEQLLNSLRGENNATDEDVLQNLLGMEEGIVGSINEIDGNNPLVDEFKRRADLIASINGPNLSDRNNRAAKAFLNIVNFCTLTKTDWFVVS